MPRLTKSTPKYRRHRASGQAIVTLNGRDVYLGPYGSKASRAEYDRLTGEWLANGRCVRRESDRSLNVAALILAYWRHVQVYYPGPDGRPSGHAKRIRQVLGYLRRLYGHTPVADFGPLALRAVRQSIIEPRIVTVEVKDPATGKTTRESRQRPGVCRTTANACVHLIRRMFRWGVEHELVPASVYHALQAVEGLRQGKTTARESLPVRPVPVEWVEAVLNNGRPSRQVAGMVRLQLATGMRPGEACIIRGCDIDT
ncbi:MAG TPA: hypothetical protein VFB66_12400, partial [Tepidisphaeraceae bacterium]|nr:hypothetical protein [Tepidisphaeraceae bacterium]